MDRSTVSCLSGRELAVRNAQNRCIPGLAPTYASLHEWNAKYNALQSIQASLHQNINSLYRVHARDIKRTECPLIATSCNRQLSGVKADSDIIHTTICDSGLENDNESYGFLSVTSQEKNTGSHVALHQEGQVNETHLGFESDFQLSEEYCLSHFSLCDGRTKSRAQSGTSCTSIRTRAPLESLDRHKKRRILVPLPQCSRNTRSMTIPGLREAFSDTWMHLRDPTSMEVHTYPVYSDTEIGLGELGSLMDEEMCAVPKNCREDDDAETTSDVLALGVRTVERYISAVAQIAHSFMKERGPRRMCGIYKRLVRK